MQPAAAATEEALHEREITFAALAQVAPVGIMRFDAQGRCNYVNDRWTELSGLSIDRAIGDGWMQAIHPEDRAAAMERWRSLWKSEGNFREEYRLRREDGATRWVLAEGAPLRSYAGEVTGFIRAVTDVTRHRELENELISARAELEQRVRERTADLQAEICERQKLEKQVLETRDDEQRRFSHDLHDGLGQYLTGILFRVLALERDLAADGSPRAESASQIAELVNETIAQAHDLALGIDPVPLRTNGLKCALDDLVKRLCRSRSIECEFECDARVECGDKAAATHLYRIAQEAITNAMKHSGATRIAVRLRKDAGGASLAVQDNGSGFAVDDAGCAGRGLTIMKHRAGLIGAVLEVQSEDAGGTLIQCRFALPQTTVAA
ncbi:MAG: PAS domain-containing sensor histidine kinase [Chthoniobacterales bacterium]